MQLFERIKIIIAHSGDSQATVARHLGVTQQGFNQWLTAKSQKNLWEHLPKILELFPQISRNWLYFGEGEMIGEQITTTPESAPPSVQDLQAKNTELEEELREANRLNRRLMERLLDGSKHEQGARVTC